MTNHKELGLSACNEASARAIGERPKSSVLLARVSPELSRGDLWGCDTLSSIDDGWPSRRQHGSPPAISFARWIPVGITS